VSTLIGKTYRGQDHDTLYALFLGLEQSRGSAVNLVFVDFTLSIVLLSAFLFTLLFGNRTWNMDK
jgi:hypothetical protein